MMHSDILVISELSDICIIFLTLCIRQTLSYGGTMLAMFRTTKASPGWKFRTCEGQTRESEHAKTINCIGIKDIYVSSMHVV
jgi:hypothetical protein